MEAGEPLAGAVVMDHQVVIAQHMGLLFDIVHNQPLQLRAGRFTQEGGDGLPGQVPAADQDENRYAQAHEAVDAPAKEVLRQGGDQHRTGGDAVVAAVGGGGLQRGGADAAAQVSVEPAEPELYKNGDKQNGGGKDAEFHRRGIQDFQNGGFAQLKADENNHHCHRQTRQIFKPGMTVGMVLVGGPGSQPEAKESDDGAGGVGKIVHGVGGDGKGTAEGAGQKLSGKQHQIAENAHSTCQGADG